jgi:hypothetical protein
MRGSAVKFGTLPWRSARMCSWHQYLLKCAFVESSTATTQERLAPEPLLATHDFASLPRSYLGMGRIISTICLTSSQGGRGLHWKDYVTLHYAESQPVPKHDVGKPLVSSEREFQIQQTLFVPISVTSPRLDRQKSRMGLPMQQLPSRPLPNNW